MSGGGSRAKVSVRVTYSISQKPKIKRATSNTNRTQKLITPFQRRAKDLICKYWSEHVPWQKISGLYSGLFNSSVSGLKQMVWIFYAFSK